MNARCAVLLLTAVVLALGSACGALPPHVASQPPPVKPHAPSAVARVDVGKHHGYAFHAKETIWVTALHVLGTETPSMHAGSGATIVCSVSASDAAHDIALIDCPGTASEPTVAVDPALDGAGGYALAYHGNVFADALLHHRVSRKLSVPADFGCKLGDGAIVFDDVPEAGESGAPIVTREADGTERVVAVWVAAGRINGASGASEFGIAIDAAYVSSLLRSPRSANATVAAPTLVDCASALRNEGRDAPEEQCRDAAANGSQSVEDVARTCGTLELTTIRELRANALWRRSALDSVRGPAGWLIAIDSAFAPRPGASLRALVRHDSALTRAFEQTRGVSIASRFEIEIFSRALRQLQLASQANPQLATDALAFFHARTLDSLTVLNLALRLGNEKLGSTPEWMICALVAGMSQPAPDGLAWGNGPDFLTCMTRRRGQGSRLFQTQQSIHQKCADEPADVHVAADSTWGDWMGSPRMQAEFWIALEVSGFLDLDRAFKGVVTIPGAELPPFAATLAQLREELSAMVALGNAVDSGTREGAQAILDLTRYEPMPGRSELASFVHGNVCTLPKGNVDVRLAADYFRAVTKLGRGLCGSPNDSTYRPVCTGGEKPDAEAPVNTNSAAATLRGWLSGAGLNGFGETPLAIAKIAGTNDYSVILSGAEGTEAAWVDFRERAIAATGESIDALVVRMAARVLGVRPRQVSVTIVDGCNQLRIRALKDGSTFTSELRCTANRIVRLVAFDLDKLKASVPTAQHGNVEGLSLEMAAVFELLRKALEGTTCAVDSDDIAGEGAEAHREVEVTIHRCYNQISQNGAWDYAKFTLELDIPRGANAKRMITFIRMMVLTASGTSLPNPDSSESYKPVDSTFKDQIDRFFNTTMQKLMLEVEKLKLK